MKKKDTTKTKTGGEWLPASLWNLLKDLDDMTLAKIEHVRKEEKFTWQGVVLFLLKKVQTPNKQTATRKTKGKTAKKGKSTLTTASPTATDKTRTRGGKKTDKGR